MQYLGRWGGNAILHCFEEAEFDLKLSGNAVLADTPDEEETVSRAEDVSEEKEENEGGEQ